jgi:hypothetical protein
MRRPLIVTILLVVAFGLKAQQVQFIRPDETKFTVLSTKEERSLERQLANDFPTFVLRRKARGSGKAIAKRITYDIVKQHGKKYILAVFNAKWENYASQLSLYRYSQGSIVKLYKSRSWLATYFGYSFEEAKVGRESVILFREGSKEQGSFTLASVFTFSDQDSMAAIRDLTPKMPSLSVRTDFPFRPLLAKNISLRSSAEYLLTASDGFTENTIWSYDAAKRKLALRKPPISSVITTAGK